MTMKNQTAAKGRGQAQPVFIATTEGDVVSWEALSSKYATKGGKGGEKSQALTDPFAQQYTQYGLISPPFDLDLLMSLLQVNTWHNRCCEVKAQDVAGLGFGFQPAPGYDKMVDLEVKTLQTFFNDPKIFDRPVSQIFVDCQKDFETIGCLALEVVREGYDGKAIPALLAHVPSNTIRPHKEGNKFAQKRGTSTRWFKRFGYDKDVSKIDGTEAELNSMAPDARATELIWDVNYNGMSDFYGMAPIVPAIGSIEGCIAVRDYNIDFFRNHGVPAYAVYVTGDYNLGKMVRVRLEDDGSGTLGEVYDPSDANMTVEYFQYKIISQVQKHLSSLAKNPHAPLILAVPGATAESRVEIKFVPLSVDVKESSFRLYKKDNRDEIIVSHGIPSYRIGLTETGSLGGSTAVESTRIYRDSVVNPRKDRLANLVNVIIWQGFQMWSVEFYFNQLDLAEEDHEKELATFMMDNAAMTPNEARVALGTRFGLKRVDGIPELDEFYMKGQPVKSLGKTLPTAPNGFVEAVKGFQTDLERIVITDNDKADK